MESTHELVVVVANTGFSDIIMDAAREAGARGGTIVHARGTGNVSMQKQYGIAITPDKEMILILVGQETRDTIIESINKVAGIDKPARSIIFSLPASNVAGLKFE